MKFAKFLRIYFFTEHLQWLFLISVPLIMIVGSMKGFRDNKICRKCQKQSVRGVLQKKIFLEISQNSQESTCARVSFLIKLQASGRTPPVAASDILFFVRFVISNSAGAPEVSHVPFEERLFTTNCWFLL